MPAARRKQNGLSRSEKKLGRYKVGEGITGKVVQTGRLGGAETIRADVRIVAASNQELEEAVKASKFREDLYYRLNVFPIYLPPLRERKSDILLLADHFLEKYARGNKVKAARLLGTTVRILSYRCRKLEIDPRQYRT